MTEQKQVIPEGYKQTEVGVIPEDWDIQRLGVHATFKTGPFGSALHKSDYVDGGIPVVNPMQIIDGKVKPTSSMAISDEAAKKLSEYRLIAGDIVIGRRGDMGRCAVISEIENGWLCGTGSMIVRVKENADAAFLQRVLSNPQTITAIESASVGTTMINLNQGTLRALLILIPRDKQEQTAIANALSDVDALISELEKLIAKKQAIKTATMQQLLTGKTRLPQFALREDGTPKGYKASELGEIPEDWEVYCLPDVIWYQEGPGLRKWQFTSKGLKVINVTNLQESGRLELDRTDRHISWEEYEKTYKHFSCDESDLVIASSGNSYCKASIVRACDLPLLMNTSVIRFKPLSKFSKGFMDVYLRSTYFKEQIDLLITGGAQPNFGPAHLNKIKIPAPVGEEEQSAIATILTDMDEEIQTLQQRLNKTSQIKQGMMQELLTGKTRLIKGGMHD